MLLDVIDAGTRRLRSTVRARQERAARADPDRSFLREHLVAQCPLLLAQALFLEELIAVVSKCVADSRDQAEALAACARSRHAQAPRRIEPPLPI
jgi:hypothetical protein